ncbi:MAG: glutamate racemase [Candidatus Uhrbacteria bacterium]
MPLGVFDSGFGGLTVLRSINERLPEISTIYFGDNANAPYGPKSFEEIFSHTLNGVRFLFSRGCPLIILACNTASAQALRKIQQEILPVEFSDRRLLGVIRPTVEYLVENTEVKKIGVFATPATVRSLAYVNEFEKVISISDRQVTICQKACPGLVEAVENGINQTPETENLVKKYCEGFDGDAALLGCTHYPFLKSWFEKYLPGVLVLSQGEVVAEKLDEYLKRHQEIDTRLEKTGQRQFFTTGEPIEVAKKAVGFYKRAVDWQSV